MQQCQSEKIEVPKADLSSKGSFGFVSMSKDTFLVLYFFSPPFKIVCHNWYPIFRLMTFF